MPATRFRGGHRAALSTASEEDARGPVKTNPAGCALSFSGRTGRLEDPTHRHIGLGRKAADAANVPRASDFRSPDLRRRLHPPTCLQACGTRSSASNNLTAGLSLVALGTVADMDQQALSRILDRLLI